MSVKIIPLDERIRWILDTCRSLRAVSSTEKRVQDALEPIFAERFPGMVREATLGPGSIVDFLVEDIAVEVKTDGSSAAVTRQLHRYAGFEEVGSVVLVTTRMKHRAIPPMLNGKWIHIALISAL